ncbi:MAG: hypothetical protein V4515_06190 [Chloroflexota bacterium]
MSATMGRFAEPALWIVVVLHHGPAGLSALLDAVRDRDGPIGPGALLGALARLEYRELVTRVPGSGHPMYRLTSHFRGGSHHDGD